jgi:hypothetical protein
VPGAAGYVIEFEREVDGRDELKLTAELPASATSLPIPAALLVPGDYQAGVAAVSEDGNLIVVEQEFSIGLQPSPARPSAHDILHGRASICDSAWS